MNYSFILTQEDRGILGIINPKNANDVESFNTSLQNCCIDNFEVDDCDSEIPKDIDLQDFFSKNKEIVVKCTVGKDTLYYNVTIESIFRY
jgi:hypothetical protein